MNVAISIEGLQKNYDALQALKGVSFDIRRGEFFGLLGPNGAGKTTLISCIVGLVRPSGGRVVVLGDDAVRDPLAVKAKIGFCPQEINIEMFFPIERILMYQGGYFGLSRAASVARAETMLKRFNLWDKRTVQQHRLSGGMKRRLMIARAMMGSPEVLILDEPTAGVDVEQRRELWETLRALKAGGTTILLTTHYIDEAEALCERVGIIDQGKLVELESPATLIRKHCSRRVCIDVSQPITEEELADVEGDVSVVCNGHRICGVPSDATDGRIGLLVESILKRVTRQTDRRVVDMHVDSGDLEEVFVQLTGRRIDAS